MLYTHVLMLQDEGGARKGEVYEIIEYPVEYDDDEWHGVAKIRLGGGLREVVGGYVIGGPDARGNVKLLCMITVIGV